MVLLPLTIEVAMSLCSPLSLPFPSSEFLSLQKDVPVCLPSTVNLQQLSTLKPSSFNSFIFFRSRTLFVDGSHQLPYFQKLANSFPSHGGGWGKNERSFYPSRWRLPFRSSLATRHFSPRKSDELTHMDSHSCIKRASDEDAKPERAQLLPQKPWRSRESKDLSFSTCQCTKVTS